MQSKTGDRSTEGASKHRWVERGLRDYHLVNDAGRVLVTITEIGFPPLFHIADEQYIDLKSAKAAGEELALHRSAQV